MIALLVIVFILGYLAIVLEHNISIDKSSSALLTGVVCWTIVSIISPNMHETTESLMHHVSEIASILFFLMGAMTIVELIDTYDGFDIITDPDVVKRQNDEFVLRTKWFDNAEILRQATSKSGALIGMSNRFNPGKIGVIEEGALADILLINGDPLQDISILTDPEANLALIMKGGEIFKNTIK